MIFQELIFLFLLGSKAVWKTQRAWRWGARRRRTPGLRRRRRVIMNWAVQRRRTPGLRRRPVTIHRLERLVARQPSAADKDIARRRRRTPSTLPAPKMSRNAAAPLQESTANPSPPQRTPLSVVVALPAAQHVNIASRSRRTASTLPAPKMSRNAAAPLQESTATAANPCPPQRTPLSVVAALPAARRHRTPSWLLPRSAASNGEWGMHANRLLLRETARTDARALLRPVRGHAFLPGDPGETSRGPFFKNH